MTSTVLITGVTGFVGSHLLDLLVEEESTEIYGTVRESSNLTNIAHNRSEIELLTCDLVNAPAVISLVEEVEPDYVYHLAGKSSVEASWDNSYSLVNNNIVGTLNLLEGIRQHDTLDPMVLLACSSEEYGLVPDDTTHVDESTPLNPVSPYAVTKAAADMFGFQYYKSYDMKIIRTRAFNHTGPRRPGTYALSDFAKQIISIEKGVAETDGIHVGNLNAVRDYSDVRDVVRGYRRAVEKCAPGNAYNISSGCGYSIRELLAKLIEISGNDISVIEEESRMRPVDVPRLVGDCGKFKRTTGWEPKYELEDTLRDLLSYWRDEFEAEDI